MLEAIPIKGEKVLAFQNPRVLLIHESTEQACHYSVKAAAHGNKMLFSQDITSQEISQ